MDYRPFYSYQEFSSADGSGNILIAVECDNGVRKGYLVKIRKKNGAIMLKTLDTGEERAPPQGTDTEMTHGEQQHA